MLIPIFEQAMPATSMPEKRMDVFHELILIEFAINPCVSGSPIAKCN